MSYGYNPDEADEEEDDVEDDYGQAAEANKEQTVFIIDVQPLMFSKVKGGPELQDVDGDEMGSQTYFDFAVAYILGFMRRKIQLAPKDEVAVVLYNTRAVKNQSEFEGVYTLGEKGKELDGISAASITQLQNMTVDKFDLEIGGVLPPAGAGTTCLRNALWATSQLMQASRTSRADRHIVLFSNDEDPSQGRIAGRESVLTRVLELAERQVALTFIPLIRMDHPFDAQLFWRHLTNGLKEARAAPPPASASLSSQMSSQSQLEGPDFATQAELAEEEKALDEYTKTRPDEQFHSRFQRLFDAMVKRRLRRRANWSGKLAITDKLEIGVQAFPLVSPFTQHKKYVKVTAEKHEEVRSDAAKICGDSGAVLSEITKHQYIAKTGDVPKVVFTSAELDAIKAPKPPGLRLLGFLPVSALLPHRQLKSPMLLFPSEKAVRGSTAAFISLRHAMMEKDKMAVCREVRTKRSQPKLVALVPHTRLDDSAGMQLEPDGLLMYTLPFWDDVRTPETEVGIVGSGEHEPVSEAAVDAAAAVVQLTLAEEFNLADFEDPAVARHFQLIEARALNTDLQPAHDCTEPPVREGPEVAAAFANFKQAVYAGGEGGPAEKKSMKRDREEKAGAAHIVEGYAGFAWEELAARHDGLTKLTIPQLQFYLTHHGQPKTGKKADLIDRIRTHLGLKE